MKLAILKHLNGEKITNLKFKNFMIRLLFINILLLPLFIYSQNIEGSYYSTDGKCKINLTIGKKNDYIFYLKKRKIKRRWITLNVLKSAMISIL